MRKAVAVLATLGLLLSSCIDEPEPVGSSPSASATASTVPTATPSKPQQVTLANVQSVDGWTLPTPPSSGTEDDRGLDAFFLWKGLTTAIPERSADVRVTLIKERRLLSAAVIAATGAGPQQLAAAMAAMPEERAKGVVFQLSQRGDAAVGCAPAPFGGLYCAWIDGFSIGLMNGVGSEAESIALMLKLRAAVVKPA